MMSLAFSPYPDSLRPTSHEDLTLTSHHGHESQKYSVNYLARSAVLSGIGHHANLSVSISCCTVSAAVPNAPAKPSSRSSFAMFTSFHLCFSCALESPKRLSLAMEQLFSPAIRSRYIVEVRSPRHRGRR
jgi:hypothetical protein